MLRELTVHGGAFMAELAPRERLQPSLLDRLADDEPDRVKESREHRVLSMRRLRAGVLRDLSWLLNATNLVSAQIEVDNHPLVASSVVNFGLPDIAGRAASGFRLLDLERSIRQAIWNFEPRIIRASVIVRATTSKREGQTHNVISFEVEGDLWAVPYPERLFLKTDLDLETGTVRIAEQIGGTVGSG